MLVSPRPALLSLLFGLLLSGPPALARQPAPADANTQQQVQFGLVCASLFRGLSDLSFEPVFEQAGFSPEQAALYQDEANFWTQHLMDLSGETLELANQAIATRLPQVADLVNRLAQADGSSLTELQQRLNQQINRCGDTRNFVQNMQGTLVCRGVAIPEGISYNPRSALSGSGAEVTLVYREGSLYYSSASLRIAVPDNRMLFGSTVSLDTYAGADVRYPLHLDIQWVDERLSPEPRAYLRAPYNISLAWPLIEWQSGQPPLGRVSLKRGMNTPVVAPLHFASYVQNYELEDRPRPHVTDLSASRGIWQLLQGEPANLEFHWGDGDQAYIQAMVPAFSMQPYRQLLDAAHARAASGSSDVCTPL